MKKFDFDELFAKNILESFYFKNTKLFVGDNYEKRIPDIHSNDKKIGIEVVRAELKNDFLYNSYLKKKKPSLKNIHLRSEIKILKGNIIYMPNNKIKKHTYDLPILVQQTKQKIKKAKKGNYSACENLYLCVVSYYRLRDEEVVKKYVEELKKLNQSVFEKIFLLFSTSLFIIDKNYDIDLFDYTDEEFMQIQNKTKKQMNKTKK